MSELSENAIPQFVKNRLPGFTPNGPPVLLTGGNLNFVWRLPGTPESVIIKHAPPYIASDPDIELSQDRIEFEATALQLFDVNGNYNSLATESIRPPKFYFFDSDYSVLVMEDLKEYNPSTDFNFDTEIAQTVGKSLGNFIGSLHKKTYGNKTAEKNFNNRWIQESRYEVQYKPAHKFADIPEISLSEKQEIARITEKLGKKLIEPGRCLIMGDLWPPSVLINSDHQIRLIDWEFTHFGRPLQDAAHFAAHCIMQQNVMLSKKKQSQWSELWRSFWSAYKEITTPEFTLFFDDDEIRDFHVHAGAEILIRVNGPFKKGYIFDEMDVESILCKKMIRLAADYILDNENYIFL